MSPGLALGLLIVLIGAQVAWLARAVRVHYIWVLVLAAIGFVTGELFAIASGLGGPLLGGLHPVAGAIAIALAEAAGALLGPRPRRP